MYTAPPMTPPTMAPTLSDAAAGAGGAGGATLGDGRAHCFPTTGEVPHAMAVTSAPAQVKEEAGQSEAAMRAAVVEEKESGPSASMADTAAVELPPSGTMTGTRNETLTCDDVSHALETPCAARAAAAAAPPSSARAPAVVVLRTHVGAPAVATVASVAAVRTVVDVALRVAGVHEVLATPAGTR